MQMTDARSIRIFVSSPGDVAEERAMAKKVIEGMQTRYAGHFKLVPVFWEQMPLLTDSSFQQGIDAKLGTDEGVNAVLDPEKGIDIAIFILWSRFGSPTGPNILKVDGTEYASGTEREYDVMKAARERSNGTRPKILVYRRRDDESFSERLRGKSTTELGEFVDQKRRLEDFMNREFTDQVTNANKGAYHSYVRPVEFTQRLRAHLYELLDELAEGVPQRTIWDTKEQGAPFRGLEAFQPEHSPIFFGREEEIQEACLALRQKAQCGPAFLMLLGASGSGKSSLARAGVLPAVLEYERNDQVEHWRSLITTPSELAPDLVLGLVKRLLDDGKAGPEIHASSHQRTNGLTELMEAESGLSSEVIAADLRRDPELTCRQVFGPAFQRAATKEKGSVRLLLLIDQLEELFTAESISIAERGIFLEVIRALANTRKVWVLVTARSDFYQQLQTERVLVDLKSEGGQLDVLPPGADALQRLVELPARLCGLRFEEWNVQGGKRTLADVILKDAAKHAELLPLIEFVLRGLYEKRVGGVLTRGAYKELGNSVEGALAKSADEVFNELPKDARDSLPEVLQSLVGIVQDRDPEPAEMATQNAAQGSDRVVRLRADLDSYPKASPQRKLVDEFVKQRLFTTGKHPETGAPTITVAHESLLRVWPRATAWVDGNRDFLRVRSRIESRMKEGGLMLEGDQLLGLATVHLGSNPKGFSAEQKSFIEASNRAAKSARTRRIALISTLAAVAIVTIVATIVGFLLQRERDAMANQFEAQSERNLAIKDFARAEMAAAQSLIYRDSPSNRELLLRARSGGVRLVSRGDADGKLPVLSAFSQDGMVVAYLLGPDESKKWRIEVASTKTGGSMGIVSGHLETPPECMEVYHDQTGATVLGISTSEHLVVLWKYGSKGFVEQPVELSMGKDKSIGRHKKRVPSLAFHPVKPWIATSGEDRKLCLWDYSQSPPRLIWEQSPDGEAAAATHDTAIHGIAFNSDGTLLASGGGDYLAKIWKTEDMAKGYEGSSSYAPHTIEPDKTMEGHSDSVFAVAFSPDGTKLASSGYDRVIRVWDLALKDKDGQPPTVGTLSGHEGTVLDLAFSNDSQILVSGAKDETVRIWDASEARIIATFRPECGVIRSVAFVSLDDDIHCGGEHGWNIWSARGRKVMSRIWNGTLVGAIAFDPKDRFVATGASGMVRLWSHDGKHLKDLPTTEGETVNGVAVSPSGRWLAAAGEDKVVSVFDIEHDWQKQVPTDENALKHKGAIWGLTFGPNDQWLASGNTDEDKRIYLWSVGDWSRLNESPEQEHSVYTLASNGAGSRLISGDSDGKVLIWDATSKPLKILEMEPNVLEGERNVWSVAVCPEPLSIFSGNSNGYVYRWDAAKDGEWRKCKPGEKIAIPESAAAVNHTVNSVSYCDAEKWVAAVGDGGSLEIYDVNLKPIRSLPGHDGTVWYVAFNPQGSRLASGGADKFLRVWNVAELKKLLETATPEDLLEETKQMTGMSVEGSQIQLAKARE